MKLKLDLHPIFGDGEKIEAALQQIIDEACDKRASEVEIIPGKGSGALKKSVLRFLDRPDVKSRYHRIEKDADNWGRVFVHFRWDHSQASKPAKSPELDLFASVRMACFCCESLLQAEEQDVFSAKSAKYTQYCGGCGSPNAVTLWTDRAGRLHARVEPGY